MKLTSMQCTIIYREYAATAANNPLSERGGKCTMLAIVTPTAATAATTTAVTTAA